MNQSEFEQLTKDFYELFHTLISVFDSNKRLIASSPHFCDFCSLVRTCPSLERRCLSQDREALEICANTSGPYTYHCHMGLIETATPIVKGGTIQGYLLFGQLTDDKENKLPLSAIEALTEDIDKRALRKALNSVNQCTPERIEAMSRMLVMCAAYLQSRDVFLQENERMADAITDYIHNHISERILCTDLCRHLLISRSSLYALSKSAFGMGISEYINAIKINIAKEKLKNLNCSISQIAEETGFPDGNYFCKVFKRYVGMTPGRFRKVERPYCPTFQ